MLGLGVNVAHPHVGGDWTPSELTGLVGWYRFNTDLVVAGGVDFPTDGEDVGRWLDHSGNANHASKSSDEPSYDGTLKSVYFDTTQETLDIPQLTLGTFAMYVRVRFIGAAITSADVLMQDDTTSNNFWRIQNTTGIRCKIGGWATALNYTLHSSTTLVQNTWYNMGLERDLESGVYSYLDGEVNGAAVTSHLESYPFLIDSIHGGKDMLVSEVIITTNPLSSAERALVDTWLSSETEA